MSVWAASSLQGGRQLLLGTGAARQLANCPNSEGLLMSHNPQCVCLLLLLLLLYLLQLGRLVEGKVVWVGDSEVKVILQNNGMEAFIPQVSTQGIGMTWHSTV